MAEADPKEGFVIARVTLDPARKCAQAIQNYGERVYAGSAGRDLVKVDETLGWIRYTLSAKRLNTAQKIATNREA